MSRKYLMGTLIVILLTASSLSAQKTLDVIPVYQRTPVWCWVTVGEMVFTYYGVANINPAGDFQCGIIALLNPVCNQNCYNCQVPAGSRQRMFNMLTQYPAFASGVSNSSTKITIQPINRPLTLADLKSEIDAGRPVIAGISPSGYQAAGVSQHVALIVGYNNDSLIVNDPFPFGTDAFLGNPYQKAGGQEISQGQFSISYSSFISGLVWQDSIFQINCTGKDCLNNESAMDTDISLVKDDDSREMRTCLSQFPEACVQTCMNFYGLSESDCRTRRCLTTKKNITNWRNTCERKVSEAKQVAEAKGAAEKLGSYGDVITRIIQEAKTRFNSLVGKKDDYVTVEDTDRYFSKLSLPNARQCQIIDSQVGKDKTRSLYCEMPSSKDISTARNALQNSYRDIDAALPKGRYVLAREDAETPKEDFKSYSFIAQNRFDPNIDINTHKRSDEYVTTISFQIVDSPALPSANDIRRVLSSVIENSQTGFEGIKGDAIRSPNSWRSKLALTQRAFVSLESRRTNQVVIWRDTGFDSLPTNEYLAFHKDVVQVLKTLTTGWDVKEDSYEYPETKDLQMSFTATKKDPTNIEIKVETWVSPDGGGFERQYIELIVAKANVPANTTPISTPTPTKAESGQVLVPINSEPVGAEIWVDGKFVGSTPSSIKLGTGTHIIKMTRPTYKDWIREIVITEGETKTVTAFLEKNP